MFMHHKQLFTEGLLVSQTKPILIDTDQEQRQTKHINTVATISKLPAFESDNKITKILYSKFLVKGVKPINSDIMLSKLKGCYEKKSDSKSKGNSSRITKQRIVTDLNSSHNKLKVEKPPQKQLGIFQLSRDQGDKFERKGRPQTAFQRSFSLNHLNRPLSAAIHQNKSQKNLTRPVSMERSATKNRSVTAISRTNSAKNQLQNRFQINEQAQNRKPIMTITDEYSNFKNINYIEKNKREASVKKQNTYITDVQIVNNLSAKKLERQNESAQIKKEIDKNYKSRRERETVTAKQKQRIKQKHINYLNYLRQNQPQQYSQCINYLISLDEDGQKLENFIFDIPLGTEDDFQPPKKEQQEQQIKDFYQNFYNACLDVEYGIKKSQKKQQNSEKVFDILNIYECEQLLSIYDQIKSIREYNADCSSKIQRIRQIIKNLSFFRELKADILTNMLQMSFSIETVAEDTEIILENAEIKKVYIILNGSVAKKNKQQDDLINFNSNNHKIPQFFTTLFDGQAFGLPSKPQQKILSYSIRTLERCLLMVFPYEQYRKALSNNQNIEDRIQILKTILPSISGSIKLCKEDFQIIAFQIETNIFSAQEVIYRQGERCSNLIIVAGGKIAVCFQSFLTRKKNNNENLRKIKNQVAPKLKMVNFRRKNLKNFEIVHENAESITYYYSEIIQQKIRGDVLNWQNFYRKIEPQFQYDEDSIQKITYSIISMQDNTRIYQLTPDKIEFFPNHIQNAFIQRGHSQKDQNRFKRNQKEIKIWENYKHDLVSYILSQKNRK